MIAAHITHEAVEKMGGIGAVIGGLLTAKAYVRQFHRSILVGPLFTTDRQGPDRLGPGGKVLYSSLDGIDAGGWARKFQPIEQSYQVNLIYGTRVVADGPGNEPVDAEVLLLDVFRINKDRLNLFKAELFNKFGIPCDKHQDIWEFEEYVRLAEPAYEALHAIGCQASPEDPLVIFAHEYMGMPTCLKAISDGRPGLYTIFYAHECASVRRIVENHEGHDLMFYNLMARGMAEGKTLEDYFPDVRDYYKHPLVKAARHCDAIFAVGELVGQEMNFLDPSMRDVPIERVYNGVPACHQTLAQRQAHRGRMKAYARNLFGFEPDYVFTHVARPVLSKGVWRDLRVLHELDGELRKANRTAAYFMLGTLAGQRRTRDVLHMERVYGWPMHHTLGYPDLCNGEEGLGSMFEDFNRHHEHARVVLVNQFGWERRLCGLRMPEDMTFADVRCGTDAEFGLSVYEPFGISQFEPLGFGGICLVSNVCGCASFLRDSAKQLLPQPNLLEGDFTQPPEGYDGNIAHLGMQARDHVEQTEGRRLALELMQRLPNNDRQVAALLDSGWALGQRITWERVVEDHVLPAIERIRQVDTLEQAGTGK